jgi:AmmeMemoRadiSam system protein A
MSYAHTLAEDEEKELLRIARATVKEYLLSGRIPPGAPHRASLVAPAAVFVSFHHGEDLRGCIGTTQESSPLFKAVQEMTIAAATRDPRYPPIRLEELPGMTIEVSVLGNRAPVKGPDDVTIGEHGLMVTNRLAAGERGLLLPKVAVEQGWNPVTFLEHTCLKAGLPPEFWATDEAVVERFTAQVFDEKTMKAGPFAPPKT